MSNNVIRKTTNRWTKGLVMDFSPENTLNEVLTHALNATLLTFNGNELSLQNDMGNARVETAYLPEGYIPVGTCEYGGIIYIVSYNPLEDKSQIGCFPSPERNISNEELGIPTAILDRSKFQGSNGIIKNLTQQVLLKSDNLNPGDKFIICAENALYNERLADLWVNKDDKRYVDNPLDNPNGFELVENPIIALHVVSIEESGRIVYLNSDVRQYEKTNTSYIKDPTTDNIIQYNDVYKYHILGGTIEEANQMAKEDIDNYRNTLSSGYNVFKSKTSGKLAILAELLTIDSYSVTHSVQPRKAFDENGEEYTVESSFDIVIHTEITPTVTPENFNLVPKLLYYYLKHSQGYLHSFKNDDIVIQTLFKEGIDRNTKKHIITKTLNDDFLNTNLSDIYTLDFNESLTKTGQFNFPKIDTYHGYMQSVTDNIANAAADNKTYTKFTEGKYHRTTAVQLMGDLTSMSPAEAKQAYDNFSKYYIDELQARFYYYDHNKTGYQKVEKPTQLEESYTYYVKTTAYKYTDAARNMEKYKDKGIPLYKYSSEPSIATDSEINNTAVEKFQEQEVHTYFEVNQDDYDITEKLYYYDEAARKYIELLGEPQTGVTYYALEIEVTFVSIGKEINKDNYKGNIYYYPTKKDFVEATESDLEKYWDIVTYPLSSEAPWGCPIILYERTEEPSYRIATDSEILTFTETDLELFYKPEYVYLENMSLFKDSFGQLFIVLPMDTFVSTSKFKPDPTINYIQGCEKPTSDHEFPKDDPLILYTVSNFIPQNLTNDDEKIVKQYEDLKLANIKIPRVITNAGIDLPFKYDYTLVPCMNFGKLDHLAVSNTVDFSKLHNFQLSNFTTWKYRIDDNLLRLTFGADVFDTYENTKVDALILEFYDCWGFAGSLEISNKKSYSGIFTKIIPLNTVGALSKKRIIGNNYSDKYKRNINIIEEVNSNESIFKFNNKQVTWADVENGWLYIDESQLSDADNDCGVLYSNLVYGVRTYLRRSDAQGYDFIPTKEMFLFTLPIYNDYYYTVNDFTVLENPTLEMMLTYKIKDSSSKIVYDNGDTIKNGYSEEDKQNIDLYTSGTYPTTSLNVTKYFKYDGITDLYLEVGLLKDYQNLNISYSNDINEYFTCTLLLLGESNKDSKSFTVETLDNADLSSSVILGYTLSNTEKPLIEVNQNTLTFTNNTNIKEISSEDFVYSNFIYSENSTPISIQYEFIVGYNIDITDIVATNIPTTTVCALCHLNDGAYNYEDFGIREVINDEGKSVFMSDVMFYNQGTVDQEIFGICRQVHQTGNILEQCHSITSVESDSHVIKTPGKLNTGEPLKEVLTSINKLLFCAPHAHGLSEENQTNIYTSTNDATLYGVPAEQGQWGVNNDKKDDCYGTIPTQNLYSNPKYNLVLNTVDSIKYNSEFISTTKGISDVKGTVKGCDTDSGNTGNKEVNLRSFVGLSGSELTQFNEKLLTTLKDIYVYNPDYDFLSVNVGKVIIKDTKPRFTSNIVCTNSLFNFGNLTLNSFIYLGSMLFATYLTYMHQYSENANSNKIQILYTNPDTNTDEFLKTITFVPGYTYCGTSDNNYLISPLTYDIPIPLELENELSFKSSSLVTVKHSDGSISQVNGNLNKKAFYGFNKDLHKLIQLDVSNYTIDRDGNLILKADTEEENSYTENISETPTSNSIIEQATTTTGYISDKTFVSTDEDDNSTFSSRLRISAVNNSAKSLLLACDGNSLFVAIPFTDSLVNGVYTGFSGLCLSIDSKYTYSISNIKSNIKCYATLLEGNEFSISSATGSKVNLIDLNINTLNKLIALESQDVSVITPQQDNKVLSRSDYLAYYILYVYILSQNNTQVRLGTEIKNFTGSWINPDITWATDNVLPKAIQTTPEIKPGTCPYIGDIILMKIVFSDITYNVTRKTRFASLPTEIISTPQTRQAIYSEKLDGYIYKLRNYYAKTCFRGTSLTINDLFYEPNIKDHRLFVKNNLCVYDNTNRGKIYYRYYNNGNSHSSWKYTDSNRYKNALYLYTGPCFDPDNLKSSI